MTHALTILSLFFAAWALPSDAAMILLLTFSVGCVIAHWLRADTPTTPRYQPAGYSRDEQIADFPEAVERGLRRSS